MPPNYPGAGRRVYPGFLQHTGFVAMNPDRHVSSHYDYFLDLIRGDDDSAESHREFYDEYNAVLDMPAEYYLDTIKTVFQDFALVNGTWDVDGKLVRPQDITTSALLTIEGELDDISGAGQTRPRTTCAPASRRHAQFHYDVEGAGHYGIFSGRRWREKVYPEVRAFIAQRTSAAPPAPAREGGPQRRAAVAPQPRQAAAVHGDSAHAPRADAAGLPPAPTWPTRIDAALPQTQCTRCGYPDCRGYAEAIAAGEADINRCPPGGAEGIVRLAALTGRPVQPLDPTRGIEGPRALAVIDEDWCIGCTLCIKACPVDCIVGASKRHAHRDRRAVHRLRAVRAGLPGGLHRDGAGHRRAHRLGRLEPGAGRRRHASATPSTACASSAPGARTTSAWPPGPRPSWPTCRRTSALDRPGGARAQARRGRGRAGAGTRAPATADRASDNRPTSSPSSPRSPRPTRTRRPSSPTPACSSCWPRCCCRRRPPTSASTRPRARCSRARRRRRRCWRSGVDGVDRAHPHDRPVPHQGEATWSRPAASWSSSTAAQVPRTREALRGPARRRPQDRQRGAQRRLRRADDGRRHAHLPGRQPHRPGARARTRCAVEQALLGARAGALPASTRTTG